MACGGVRFNLGTLKVLSVVGEGAHSTVRKATVADEHGATHTIVLKCPRHDNAVAVEACLREAQLLQNIEHRHIITFYGMASPGGNAPPALLLEFMDRGSLRKLVLEQMIMPRRQLYSNKQATQWCLHVAEALQFLHSRQVSHRDVKLENILLQGTVEGGVVKLVDFGLHSTVSSRARATAVAGASRRGLHDDSAAALVSRSKSDFDRDPATEQSSRTGSLMYMAPEMYTCSECNEQVDIFSLGVAMYELFSRYLVLASVAKLGVEREVEAHAQAVAQGYRPEFPQSFPPALRQLVCACWAADPQARPTAGEVCAQLQQVLASLQPAQGQDGGAAGKAAAAGGKPRCCVIS